MISLPIVLVFVLIEYVLMFVGVSNFAFEVFDVTAIEVEHLRAGEGPAHQTGLPFQVFPQISSVKYVITFGRLESLFADFEALVDPHYTRVHIDFDASDVFFSGDAVGKRDRNQFDQVLDSVEKLVEVGCVGHYRPDVVGLVVQTQMCQGELLVPNHRGEVNRGRTTLIPHLPRDAMQTPVPPDQMEGRDLFDVGLPDLVDLIELFFEFRQIQTKRVFVSLRVFPLVIEGSLIYGLIDNASLLEAQH